MKKKRQITLPYLLAKSLTAAVMCAVLLFLWDASSKATEQGPDNGEEVHKNFHPITVKKKEKPKTEQAVKKPALPKKETMKQVSAGDSHQIYLTFDDGPTPTTGKLLDILKKHRTKATFFMLEPNMKKHKDEVKRLYAEGNGMGLHGVTHNPKAFYRSPASVVGEMKTGQSTLKSLTGYSTNLVRTPYGSAPYLTLSEKNALAASGFTYWDWNVDSDDWKYKQKNVAAEVFKQIEKQKKDFPRQPIVVLMHDRSGSLSSVDSLLTMLENKGFTFRVLNDHLKPVHFG